MFNDVNKIVYTTIQAYIIIYFLFKVSFAFSSPLFSSIFKFYRDLLNNTHSQKNTVVNVVSSIQVKLVVWDITLETFPVQ